MPDTIIQTSSGRIEGYTSQSTRIWKGIPYAKPPVGALRFMPPQSVEPWEGTRPATTFGSAAFQGPDLMEKLTGRPKLQESEDCLYLNIWAPPEDGKKHPVMVWIHGGAFLTGAGSIAWYDGRSFVEQGEVVLVTINYRLGALGFLYLKEFFGDEFKDSGNLGLLDQIAALSWVRENIALFGGDPEQITVFGESAGAGSIAALLAMPAAKGMFRRAIMQSGSGHLGTRTTVGANQITKVVLERTGIEPGDVDALRAVPPRQLVAAATDIGGTLPFGPVIDGATLPVHPMDALRSGTAAHIPLIIGVTKDEYRLMTVSDFGWLTDDVAGLRQRIKALGPVPDALIDFYLSHMPGQTSYEKLVPLLTYAVFVQGLLRTVELQHAAGGVAFAYRFDAASPILGGRLGACHAMEIPFVFNNLQQKGVIAFTGDEPERDIVAQQMHRAWIAFAHTGNPNHEGQPAWPEYSPDTRAVLAFGRDTHVLHDPWALETKAWTHSSE